MAIQIESVALTNASVDTFRNLVGDIQSKNALLTKALDGIDTPQSNENEVVIDHTVLSTLLQSLEGCNGSVQKALEFLKQEIELSKPKHDEDRQVEKATAALEPEAVTDEVVEEIKSGTYKQEEVAEHEPTNDSAAKQAEYFPSEILLENVNHLMFVVHGIGEHDDFIENAFDDVNRQGGSSGGFRELFSTIRDSQFSKEIPLSLEIHPIEWHAQVHNSGADDAFDAISPEASSMQVSRWLRSVNRRLVMDVLYYSAPRYGQMIVDSVTKQMNTKYHDFIGKNPGWDGHISIFAHSLGTLISYDILSHDVGEVGDNGVVFPGLDFPVENLFCAGSPVPIFALSRGRLNIVDGKCIGGFRMPKVNHYFNLFHPADPVAYRVEPMVNSKMNESPPMTLEASASFKNKSFGEMVQIYDQLADKSPMADDWSGPRIDFQVRRKFFEGPVDTLYAPLSHSVYWSSQDLVTITIMAICRPVVDILTRYMDNKVPLPKLLPRRVVDFTPYKRVKRAITSSVRDSSTGAWISQAIFLGKKRVYFAPSASQVACTRSWSIPLTSNSEIQVDLTDPLSFKFIPDKRNPNPSIFSDAMGTQLLKAESTALRQEWLDEFKKVLDHVQNGTNTDDFSVDINGLDLPYGTDVAFFDARLTSTLRYKKTLSWGNAWYVLHRNRFDCYEECPQLEKWTHFSLKNVFATPDHGHFRLVSRYGASISFKVENRKYFDAWLETMKEFEGCKVIIEDCD